MDDKELMKKKVDMLVKKIAEERTKDKDEKEIVWICSEKSMFPDDVEAKCERCGKKIYHRPYAKGRKLCIKCAEEESGIPFRVMLEEAVERIESEIRKNSYFFAM